MIVYVSIGNSDDKLTQKEWAAFVQEVADVASDCSIAIHGQWLSLPSAPYQNACWCVDLFPRDAWQLKAALIGLAAAFRQDSIAWAEATTTLLRGAA